MNRQISTPVALVVIALLIAAVGAFGWYMVNRADAGTRSGWKGGPGRMQPKLMGGGESNGAPAMRQIGRPD